MNCVLLKGQYFPLGKQVECMGRTLYAGREARHPAPPTHPRTANALRVMDLLSQGGLRAVSSAHRPHANVLVSTGHVKKDKSLSGASPKVYLT